MSATMLPSAASLYEQARSLLMQGRPEDALVSIADAREQFQAEGDDLGALRTDLGRINVLDDLGRHSEALQTAVSLVRSIDDVDAPSDQQPLLDWLRSAANENLGAALGWHGSHEGARRALEASAAGYRSAGSTEDVARVSANLGIEALETGDLHTAREALEAALPQLVEDPALAVRCRQHLALVEARAGNFARATALTARDDAGVSDNTGDNVDGARRGLVAARVSAELNLWEDVAEQATALHEWFLGNGLVRDAAEAAGLLAMALTALGDPETGEEHGLASVEALRELSLDVRAAAMLVELAASGVTVDGEALPSAHHVLRAAGELLSANEAALLLAEDAETDDARAWLNAMTQPMPATQQWRHDHLRALGLDGSERRSLLQSAVGTIRDLRGTVDEDRRRRSFMTGRRAPVDTLLGDLLHDGDAAGAFELSCEERSSSLTSAVHAPYQRPAAGTVLYQVAGERVMAFVQTTDGTELVDLSVTVTELVDRRRRLEAQCRRLTDPRMRVHLPMLRAAADSVLSELYESLLLPVENVFPTGPLTIIPAAATSGIPFNALHDGTGYVLERRQIDFAAGTRAARCHVGPVLVVGVPDERAPQIENEARHIAELTSGTLLLGADATRAAVREAIAHHGVIHIATHGSFDARDADESSIDLADGVMTARELSTTDLGGRLVVLSACSTGKQAAAGEDELLGVPRGLLLGGAARVVVNLWPVDDVASSGLMSHFYLQQATHGPSAALRSAQLAALDLHPHPALWAPAISYGWLAPADERTRP